MRYRKNPIYFIKILISLSFMTFMFYYLFGKNPDSIKRDLLLVDYKYIILSMLFGGWAYFSRGLRWVVLINALGHKTSKYNSIAAVSIGYLTNLLIPRGGELSRCVALSNAEKIPVSKLVGTIIIERIVDLIFLLVLFILSIIIKFDIVISLYHKMEGTQNNKNQLITLISIISLFLLFYIGKGYFKKSKYYQQVLSFFKGIKEGINSIRDIKDKGKFWTQTVIIWIMYFLMIYICFFSMEDTSRLTIGDGLLLLVLGGIGMLFPTPGGIGSYHYIIMISLVILQVPNGYINNSFLEYDKYNTALLFPTVVWFAQSFVAIILGSISFLILSSKK